LYTLDIFDGKNVTGHGTTLQKNHKFSADFYLVLNNWWINYWAEKSRRM